MCNNLIRFLSYLNLTLLSALFTLAALPFVMAKSEEPILFEALPSLKELPKNPFEQTEEAFQSIDTSLFALKWVPPQMQLPDLREGIIYYGKNERPDVENEFHLGLKSSGEVRTTVEGERIYLAYKPPVDVCQDRGSYTFTPQQSFGGDFPSRAPSLLWLEIVSCNNFSAQIAVRMVDEKGNPVENPAEFATFVVQKKETSTPPAQWEIGKHKVDPSLLLRQKARIVGPDKFLEMHGGEEFSFAANRERIDFSETDPPYACFIREEDLLIWKEDQWHTVQEEEETREFPLMIVKKTDERLITFDLWDPQGKSKITLNLIKNKDYIPLPRLEDEFKFVGAKTWAQFIVECKNGERLILRPNDWLLLTSEGWKNLDSSEEIDAYVEGRTKGPLFVVERLSRDNGVQALVGHLFNTTRTEVENIELPALLNGKPLAPNPSVLLAQPQAEELDE